MATRGDNKSLLLEKAEDGFIDWEDIARECIAQMSNDDCYDVCDMLGLFDQDGEEDLEDE